MSTPVRRWLVLVGIVALAFNLRPAAVSVGPVLDDVRTGLGMSAAEAGLLTSLPVVAFAVFGALASRLARAVGPHRVVLGSLVAVAAGLLARSQVEHVGAFLALSLLALAGMATGNVVLPALVKRHFPDSVGRVTAAYTTSLAVGLTAASVLTVPVSDDWRTGLALWALTAAVAALPWLGLLGLDRSARGAEEGEEGGPIGLAQVARTRLGWAMALTFGLQSLQAYAIFGWFAAIYREAGFSGTTAGLLLGVITATSIPTSLVVPRLAAARPDARPLMVGFVVCYVVGYLGLALAPAAGAVVWAVLIGLGTASFPFVLTLIGLRARTAAGTAALSGFTQPVGYLVAAPGPFLVGLLHDASGSWTLPLLVLTALTLPLLAAGLVAARPAAIEDQVR